MKRKRLLPKKHTGKLVHHHHTAYGLLVVILFMTLLPLFIISKSVQALPGDPVNGSEGVFAVVPAPVPSSAPVITSIVNGQVFSSSELVTISGSCPGDTIIKVYKNQVMAGSDLCENSTFNLEIDLFVGANSIIARAFNVNNISGPDSEPVNVRLDIGASGLTGVGQLNGPGDQLYITSETYYQGVRVKEPLKWPLTIAGGQAPYAVSIGWGDGKTDLISRGQAGTFTIEHSYDAPGQGYQNSYDVTIQATDQQGNKSFIHLVSIVGGGQPSVASSVKAGYNWSSTLRIAWQLMVLAGVIMIGFWFGEQYELRILKKKHIIL